MEKEIIYTIVNALSMLFLIAYVFFLIRHLTKETMKSEIGWAITATAVFILEIILFIIEENNSVRAHIIFNFFLFLMHVITAIYYIRRKKSK